MISPAIPRRPRLLILAYACSPLRGSESAVGWNRAIQAAKNFDTWVICEEHEFAPDVRSYFETRQNIPGLQFEFVPMPRWQWSLGQVSNITWYMMLKQWHRRAYKVALRLHEKIGFDLIHQLTFCGYREPGFLWKLNAPFVWGPVGGTQNYPWRFLLHAGAIGGARELARNMLNRWQMRYGRRIHQAGRKAVAVVAATSTVRDDLQHFLGVQSKVISDVGVPHVAEIDRPQRSIGQPLRILWSGVMQLRKALPLLIEAVALLPVDIPVEIRVLGQGRYFNAWRRLARRRGVDQHFEWLGWLPYEECQRQYTWADIFVFTSLRDTTGAVMLEALGAGLPVLCLDHQGARDLVNQDCGIKIRVSTPRQVVFDLRDAIARLARDPNELRRLSSGATDRAGEYIWSRQGEMLTEVYRTAIRLSKDSVP
ncbi:MAG: glycosyltransferase family 4 protein [Thermoguttaceae bacterium]